MKRKGLRTSEMVLLFGLVMVLLMPVLSHAQAFPTKSITVVEGSVAGAATDVLPRALCDDCKPYMKYPFVFVVKGGGAGITNEYVARSKPDGYNICSVTPLGIVVTPLLRKGLKRLEDFIVINLYTKSVSGLVVRADSPWKTMKDLVEYARKNPRKIRSAVSTGTGNFKETVLRIIAKKEGIDWIYVPHSGGDPGGLTDLLGGHIEALSAGPVWVPHVEAGRLRLLVAYNSKRLTKFPDIPTLADLGYGFSLDVPLAFIAAKGTPAPIVKKIDEIFRKGYNGPGFKTVEKNYNYEPLYMGPEEATKWYYDCLAFWQRTIKEYDIPSE